MKRAMLDRDRFAKCQALAAGGATPGERAAGRAAAARVAANAGLTLEEAERVVGGRPQASARASSPPRPEPARPPRGDYAWRRPKAEPDPITVAEILAQKAADLERRKKAAARRKREDRALHAEQEAVNAALRKAQAVRDREWAEARARRDAEPHPGGSAPDVTVERASAARG